MRCIVCDKEAQWCVKGTSTGYCDEHAHEMFSDTSYLASVEEEAQRLKTLVDSEQESHTSD